MGRNGEAFCLRGAKKRQKRAAARRWQSRKASSSLQYSDSRYTSFWKREIGMCNRWEWEKKETIYQYNNLEADNFEWTAAVNNTVPVTSLSIEKEDGRFALCSCADGSVTIGDLDNLHSGGALHSPAQVYRLGRAHTSTIAKADWFGHEKQMFMTAGYDGNLRVWDAERGESVHTFNIRDRIYSFASSPQRTPSHSLIAAANSAGEVRLCDLATGTSAHTLCGHSGGSMRSSDLLMADSATRTGGNLSGLSQAFAAATATRRQGLVADSGGVWSAVFSPFDDRYLATGDSEGVIRVWDIRRVDACLTVLDQYLSASSSLSARSGLSLFSHSQPAAASRGVEDSYGATGHDEGVVSLQFSDDGLYLYSLDRDGHARLWDCGRGLANTMVAYEKRAKPWARTAGTSADAGGLQNSIPRGGLQTVIVPGAYAVAVPSGPSVLLSEVRTGRALPSLSGHFHNVRCVTAHPFRPEVYAGAQNGVVLRWAAWKGLGGSMEPSTTVPVDNVDTWSDYSSDGDN